MSGIRICKALYDTEASEMAGSLAVVEDSSMHMPIQVVSHYFTYSIIRDFKTASDHWL